VNKATSTAILLLLYGVLSPMDIIEKTKIFSPQEIVLDVVIKECLFDSHEAVCTFAIVSKYCQWLMLKYASQTKQRLGELSTQGDYLKLMHKYGSKCYYARLSRNEFQLALGYRKLNKKKDAAFIDFISPLPHNPRPFFDNKGLELCFYGLGRLTENKNTKRLDSENIQIICYKSDAEQRACYLQHDQHFYPLTLFLSYPFFLASLVQDFGNTMSLEEVKKMNVRSGLCFSLEKAMIPDNYKEKKPFYLPASYCHTKTCWMKEEHFAEDSFEGFDLILKEAIENRYKQCVLCLAKTGEIIVDL
jgi:hypothetical protein